MNEQENPLFMGVEAAVVEALDDKCIAEFADFEGFSAWFDVVMAYDALDYADIDESGCMTMLRPVYEKLLSEV